MVTYDNLITPANSGSIEFIKDSVTYASMSLDSNDKLKIDGTIIVSNAITSSGDLIVNEDLYVAGRVAIGTAPTTSYTIVANVNNIYIPYSSGGTYLYGTGGKVSIGGGSTPKSTLSISSNLAVGSNYYRFKAAPANSAIIQGSVGIGTDSPSQSLHVIGTSDITGESWIGSSGVDVHFGSTSGAVIDMLRSGFNYIQASNTSGDLVFRTGGTNNRMIIQNDGKVGIGTTTPSELFHIKSGSDAVQIVEAGANKDASIRLLESGTGDVGAYLKYDGANNRFGIWVGNNSPTEKLTIMRDSGKIGIGTASPGAELEIQGDLWLKKTGADAEIRLYDDDGTTYAGLVHNRDNNTLNLTSPGGGYYFYDGSDSVTMSVDSDICAWTNASGGYTFDGTISASVLIVDDSIYTNESLLRISNLGTGDDKTRIELNSNDIAIIANNTGKVQIGEDTGTFQPYFTSLTGGNIGIGTATPSGVTNATVLHIVNTATGAGTVGQLVLEGSNSHTFLSAFSGDDTAGGDPGIMFHSGHDLRIGIADDGAATNWAEKVRIKANGNVGIGTTTPSEKLQVNGTISASNLDIAGSASYSSLSIINDLTVGGTVTAQEFHTEQVSSSIVFSSGSTKFGDSDGDIHQFSGSIRITGSGDHWISHGNVGIGTTSPDRILHVQNSAFANVPLFERSGQTSNIAWVGAGTLATKTTSMSDEFGSLFGFYIQDDAAVSNGIGYIGAVRAGADTTGDLVFTPVTTGTSNERMRIEAGGNVGIGETSPAELLHIKDTDDDFTSIKLENTNGGTGAGSQIYLGNDLDDYFYMVAHGSGRTVARYGITLGSYAEILAQSIVNGLVIGTGTTDKPIVFGNANTERMRIDAGGNVGIGTTSPSVKLGIGVVNSVNVNDGLIISRSSDNGNEMGVKLKSDSGGLYFGSITYKGSSGTETEMINFGDNNNEDKVVFPNVNVGIGTTSPSSSLHVYSTTSTEPELRIENENNNSSGAELRFIKTTESPAVGDEIGEIIFIASDTGGTAQRFGAKISTEIDAVDGSSVDGNIIFSTYVSNTEQERMFIQSDGNVGIGTTSPGANLHVKGSTTGAIIIDRTTDSNNADLRFFTDSTEAGGAWTIRMTGATASTDLKIAEWTGTDVTRMYFQNGGNVGIGTSVPDYTLTIDGEVAIGSPSRGIFIQDNGSVADLSGVTISGSGYNPIGIRSTAAVQLYLNTDGNTGIGTNTPSAKLQVNGSISGSQLDIGGSGSFGTLDANDTLYVTQSKVGIGTSSPGRLVDMWRSDSSTNMHLKIQNDGDGDAGIWFQTSVDWNMGIDNSDSDKFKISAGSLLTTDPAIVIDTSENVGIQTTSPSVELEVSGGVLINQDADVVALAVKGGGGGNEMAVFTRDVGANGIVAISADGGDPQIIFDVVSGTTHVIGVDDSADDTLRIGPATTVDNLTNEGISISKTGQVGINTTTPSTAASLEVSGTIFISGMSSNGAEDAITIGVDGETDASIKFFDDDAESAQHFKMTFNASREDLRFQSDEADNILYLTQDGLVGIGTDDPDGVTGNTYNSGVIFHTADTLAVYHVLESTGGTTDEVATVYNNFSTGTNSWWTGLNQSDDYIFAYGTAFTGATSKMIIQTDGKVGIGTRVPAWNVHVSGSTSCTIAVDGNGADVGYLAKEGGDNVFGLFSDDSDSILRLTNYQAENIQFSTDRGGTETIVMTLQDSTGNVGIGTTVPKHPLTVEGNISASGDIYISQPTDDLALRIYGYDDRAADYADLYVRSDSYVHLKNNSSGGRVYIGNSDGLNVFEGEQFMRDDKVFRFGTSSDYSIGYQSSTDTFQIVDGSALGTTVRVVVNSSGYVGIGTVTPKTALTVEGDISGSGNLFLTGNQKYISFRRADGSPVYGVGFHTDNEFYVGAHPALAPTAGTVCNVRAGSALNFGLSSTDMVYLRTAGFGIGTSTPTAQLGVVGSGSFSGHLTSSNHLMFDDGGNKIFQTTGDYAGGDGLIKIGDIEESSESTVFVLDDSIQSAHLTTALANTAKFGIGTASPKHPLHIVSDGYPQLNISSSTSAFSAIQLATATNTNDWRLIANSNSTFNIYDVTSGSYRFTIDDIGNVGIGTTSPSYALDVVGSARFNDVGVSDVYVGGALMLREDGSGNLKIGGVSGGSSTSIYSVGAEAIRIDTSQNVGIGTTSPNYSLTVGDGTSAEYIQLSTNSGVGGIMFTDTDNTTNQGAIRYDHSTNTMYIRTNSSEQVAINSSGYVGIGTSTPQGNLVVTGTSAASNASTGIFMITDGTGVNTDMKLNFGVVANDYGWIQAVKPGTAVRDIALNPEGGSVGINTTSPEALLHVKGADGVTGTILIEGGNTTVTALGEIHSQLEFGANDISVTGGIGGRIASVTEYTNGALAGMSFYTFQQSVGLLSEKMRITYHGRVGIGTTTPQALLHVNGNISGSSIEVSNAVSSSIVYTNVIGRYGDYADRIGFNNNRIDIIANNNAIYWDSADFYPGNDAVRGLGKSSNRWDDLYLSNNAYIDGAISASSIDISGHLTSSNHIILDEGSSKIFQTTGDYASGNGLVKLGDIEESSESTVFVLDDSIQSAYLTSALANTAKLGIGTATPITALEVVGDITISKTAASTMNISSSDANSYSVVRLATNEDTNKYMIGYGSAHSGQANQLSLKNTNGVINFLVGGTAYPANGIMEVTTDGINVTGSINVTGTVDGVDVNAVSASYASHAVNVSNPHSVTKAQVGLTDVEDTALSTWAGTSNVVTVGNIITGRTALAGGLASTDELLVSDGGTIKRMDTSVLETYIQANTGITDLFDTSISSLANGDTLTYDSSGARWYNTQPPTLIASLSTQIDAKNGTDYYYGSTTYGWSHVPWTIGTAGDPTGSFASNGIVCPIDFENVIVKGVVKSVGNDNRRAKFKIMHSARPNGGALSASFASDTSVLCSTANLYYDVDIDTDVSLAAGDLIFIMVNGFDHASGTESFDISLSIYGKGYTF